jgi:hypothetical protein
MEWARRATTLQANDIQNVAIAWSLSESAYKEAKHNAQGNAIIYGVPVGASYEEYHENARSRAEQLNITNFISRSHAYATSGFDEAGLQAYRACLAAEQGLGLVTEEIGNDSYKIWITFDPPPDHKDQNGKLVRQRNLAKESEAILSSELSNTTFRRVDRQFTVSPQDPISEVALDVSVGSVSRSLLLPPLRDPRPIDTRYTLSAHNLRNVMSIRVTPVGGMENPRSFDGRSGGDIREEEITSQVKDSADNTIDIEGTEVPGTVWSFDFVVVRNTDGQRCEGTLGWSVNQRRSRCKFD